MKPVLTDMKGLERLQQLQYMSFVLSVFELAVLLNC